MRPGNEAWEWAWEEMRPGKRQMFKRTRELTHTCLFAALPSPRLYPRSLPCPCSSGRWWGGGGGRGGDWTTGSLLPPRSGIAPLTSPGLPSLGVPSSRDSLQRKKKSRSFFLVSSDSGYYVCISYSGETVCKTFKHGSTTTCMFLVNFPLYCLLYPHYMFITVKGLLRGLSYKHSTLSPVQNSK